MSTPLESLRAAVKAAFGMVGVDLEAPRSAVMRVIRGVGTRVSIQKIDATDQAGDSNPIEVWPGVPGASCDPHGGEEVVLSFVGQNQAPFVTGWSPLSVPSKVRFDARAEIRFISLAGSVAAKVYVGATPTVPVALASNLVAYLQALEAWALQMDAIMTAAGIAGLVPSYPATITARTTAAGGIASIASTNLEAK